jgi:hypothetical protein
MRAASTAGNAATAATANQPSHQGRAGGPASAGSEVFNGPPSTNGLTARMAGGVGVCGAGGSDQPDGSVRLTLTGGLFGAECLVRRRRAPSSSENLPVPSRAITTAMLASATLI